MRFSVRIYDVEGHDEVVGYTTRRPNYWVLMRLCQKAGIEDIVDFKDDKGCRYFDPVVHGRLLKNRFNGTTPVGRYEIVHLTDDEVELEEVLR